jgi:hypothetical protein
MSLFDNVPPGSFPPGGSGLPGNGSKLTITHSYHDGGSLRAPPDLEAEYQRVYWAERTWGMSDQQVLEYLAAGNRVGHLIDAGDTLH